MNKLTLQQWLFIFTLTSLTALGPLSIDMYLPAFTKIAENLNTTNNNVQVSLSFFLAGLAIGQLFWGPISDRFGSKKPILISLTIYIIASYFCTQVKEIEYLWVLRFVQAFGSSGGLVIARSLVTKTFDQEQTLKIYSILAMVGGIAPIVAPILGNGILKYYDWNYIFFVLMIFGFIGFTTTSLFLKNTVNTNYIKKNIKAVGQNYINIFRNKTFLTYTFICSISFSSLMLYISNASLLIMKQGGLSGDNFSVIFAINSGGLMFGSFLTSTVIHKKLDPKKAIQLAGTIQIIAAILFIALNIYGASIYIKLVPLFFFILPLGILFPTSTALALNPFRDNSGFASALFGASQLLCSFVISLIVNYLSNESMTFVGFCLLICALICFVFNKILKN